MTINLPPRAPRRAADALLRLAVALLLAGALPDVAMRPAAAQPGRGDAANATAAAANAASAPARAGSKATTRPRPARAA